ncbi:hypothetical protein ABT160_23180 [Streptomyces sp. NPDC001941]|uniref:hypothetical protein n=1 Tax=Streptomyces sp. NPDC001941 TaxID=3154659 RepID=UPI00331DEE5A
MSLDVLLVEVGRGSLRAMGQLFDEVCGLLLVLAVVRCASVADAESSLAQAFVRIWREAPQYEEGSGALAWIVHHSRV